MVTKEPQDSRSIALLRVDAMSGNRFTEMLGIQQWFLLPYVELVPGPTSRRLRLS